MSFVGGLSKIIVVGSIVGCVNASSAIKFDLGSGPCGSGRFGCEFSEGYKKHSDCFDDVNELAKNISVISSNTMSARSGDFKYIEGSNNFRVVGGTKSPVLFELSGVKSSLSLGKVIFNGSVERPTSVELGFDTGSDMHLPSVDCYNIPMFKVEIGGDGNGGSIAEFKTNMKTGLSYNKCISIDGIKCNNVGREVCMIANTGTNNILNAGSDCVHTFGVNKYKYANLRFSQYWLTKNRVVTNIRPLAKNERIGSDTVCPDFIKVRFKNTPFMYDSAMRSDGSIILKLPDELRKNQLEEMFPNEGMLDADYIVIETEPTNKN